MIVTEAICTRRAKQRGQRKPVTSHNHRGNVLVPRGRRDSRGEKGRGRETFRWQLENESRWLLAPGKSFLMAFCTDTRCFAASRVAPDTFQRRLNVASTGSLVEAASTLLCPLETRSRMVENDRRLENTGARERWEVGGHCFPRSTVLICPAALTKGMRDSVDGQKRPRIIVLGQTNLHRKQIAGRPANWVRGVDNSAEILLFFLSSVRRAPFSASLAFISILCAAPNRSLAEKGMLTSGANDFKDPININACRAEG